MGKKEKYTERREYDFGTCGFISFFFSLLFNVVWCFSEMFDFMMIVWLCDVWCVLVCWNKCMWQIKTDRYTKTDEEKMRFSSGDFGGHWTLYNWMDTNGQLVIPIKRRMVQGIKQSSMIMLFPWNIWSWQSTVHNNYNIYLCITSGGLNRTIFPDFSGHFRFAWNFKNEKFGSQVRPKNSCEVR